MNMTERTSLGKIRVGVATLYGLLSTAYAHSCALSPTGNTCSGGSTTQSSPDPSTGVGDPIDLTSGNRYQQEVGVDMPGKLSIDFRRHYNSLSADLFACFRGLIQARLPLAKG